MKPGDLAIIKCKLHTHLHMKFALIIGTHHNRIMNRNVATCIVDGTKREIPCGWLHRIKDETR